MDDNDNILVVDIWNDHIQKFISDRRFVSALDKTKSTWIHSHGFDGCNGAAVYVYA